MNFKPNYANPELVKVIDKDTELKEILVDYVGRKVKPPNNEVTMEMVLAVLMQEFPAFVLALAEENWVRGYHQALDDLGEISKDLPGHCGGCDSECECHE